MKVEQFFGQVPLDRLERDLVGRAVTIRLLVVDNCQEHLAAGEQRLQERFPSRRPTPEEVRDFIALHYTPLLHVWGPGAAGRSEHTDLGLEGMLDPAVEVFSLETTVTAFRPKHLRRDSAPDLEVVEVETTSRDHLSFPASSLDEGGLAATIVANPINRRREYSIRFYNTALVFSLPE